MTAPFHDPDPGGGWLIAVAVVCVVLVTLLVATAVSA